MNTIQNCVHIFQQGCVTCHLNWVAFPLASTPVFHTLSQIPQISARDAVSVCGSPNLTAITSALIKCSCVFNWADEGVIGAAPAGPTLTSMNSMVPLAWSLIWKSERDGHTEVKAPWENSLKKENDGLDGLLTPSFCVLKLQPWYISINESFAVHFYRSRIAVCMFFDLSHHRFCSCHRPYHCKDQFLIHLFKFLTIYSFLSELHITGRNQGGRINGIKSERKITK